MEEVKYSELRQGQILYAKPQDAAMDFEGIGLEDIDTEVVILEPKEKHFGYVFTSPYVEDGDTSINIRTVNRDRTDLYTTQAAAVLAWCKEEEGYLAESQKQVERLRNLAKDVR